MDDNYDTHRTVKIKIIQLVFVSERLLNYLIF
jgi:hypothetical protein